MLTSSASVAVKKKLSQLLLLVYGRKAFLVSSALAVVGAKMIVDELQDLSGIFQLLRTHLAIRNRSWMKRVHRDCFIGSEAVDFLVTQGLADSREHAVAIGRAMMGKKMIRHVTDQQKFRDSYLYYRFSEDDLESSVLAASNAGNGSGIFFGQGGCKWTFCPHTAHNSYILDIGTIFALQSI